MQDAPGITVGSGYEGWEFLAFPTHPSVGHDASGNFFGAHTNAAAGRPLERASSMAQQWNCGAPALDNTLASAGCFTAPSRLSHHPGAASISGGVAGERLCGTNGRAVSACCTTPRGNAGSLFASNATEAAFLPFLSAPGLPRQQHQLRLSSAPSLAVAEAAVPNSGGDTGSATSASDGTVQFPEHPAARNPSASPMNSPFPQASAFGACPSVACPADPCSPPLRLPATPAAQCTTTATAAAAAAAAAAATAGTCAGDGGDGLALEAPADPGGVAAFGACEDQERRQSGDGPQLNSEESNEGAMQGPASKLPPPIRVTVGPNAFRQHQRQQQPQVGPGVRKRGRGASGPLHEHQQWGAPDGEEDSDGQKKRGPGGGGGSRAAGGRGARRDTDGGDGKPAVYGMFYPERYMVGVDCILVDGAFISRSRFEKLGGSLMAKWYRSIRVVDSAEPLGAWLERHGLPVFTGKARQRRQQSITAVAAAAVVKATAATGPGDAVKGHGGGSLGGRNSKLAKVAAHGAAPAAGEPGAGSDTDAGISTGGVGGAAGAWAGTPGSNTEAEPAAAENGGACAPVGVDAAGPATAAAVPRVPGPRPWSQQQAGVRNADYSAGWPRLGQHRLAQGPTTGQQLPHATAAVKPEPQAPNPASAPDPRASGMHGTPASSPAAAAAAATATITTPAAAAPAAAASAAAAAVAVAGGQGGAGAVRASDDVCGAGPSCVAALETRPNGAVAPGVYLFSGRPGLADRGGPPAGQQLAQESQPQQAQKLPAQQQQQQQQREREQGQHLLQQQQRQQHLPSPGGQAAGCQWRAATDGGGPLSAQDTTAQALHGAPSPPSGAPSQHNALRSSLTWGPSLSAGDNPAAGAAGAVASPFAHRRFVSDGGAGLAGGGPHLPASLGAQRQPFLAAYARAPTGASPTGVEASSGPDAAPCRLPEAPSLESVRTNAASRWMGSGCNPGQAANNPATLESYDPNAGGRPTGRRDWEADAWSPAAYGAQPPSAPAPVPTTRSMQDLQQQEHPQPGHQQQYPAMSRQVSYELLPRDPPPFWPQPQPPQHRAKPPTPQPPHAHSRPREAGPVPLPYAYVPYASQPSCQEDAPPYSLIDDHDQPAASAWTATEPPLPAPAAAASEAASPPAVQVGGAVAGATHPPPTPHKLPHPYPPAGRHWPYGAHYWPYHPAAPMRGGAPVAPPRQLVAAAAAAGGVRPYYRSPYPREVAPGGAMPPAFPPPPPPYTYYYGHPYARRGAAMYRRRYAVSAPGAVEAPPPAACGAGYDLHAVQGAYAPARQEPEAPLDAAGSGMAPLPYPATGAFPSDGEPMTMSSTQPRMPLSATAFAPAPTNATNSPAGPAMPAAASVPNRLSSGGGGTPGNPLSAPSHQHQQHQQHHSQGSAAAAAALSEAWASTPPNLRHVSASGLLPASLVQGGGGGLGAGVDGAGAAPAWRTSVGLASAAAWRATGAGQFGAAASAAETAPCIPTAGGGGGAGAGAGAGGEFAAGAEGLTTAGSSGRTNPFAAAGGDSDLDPMWDSFQRWSAEEAAQAPPLRLYY